MELRAATPADLVGLTALYNEVIATSTAIYSSTPVTVEDRQRWWHARTQRGFPVLVAADATGMLGFSTFGEFRPLSGYRFTVEHSVYVRADQRGGGIGTQLVAALFPHAAALGIHTMIAAIDGANTASIRFHERLGFHRSGCLAEVGRKFDRWLDLVFLQRRIDA